MPNRDSDIISLNSAGDNTFQWIAKNFGLRRILRTQNQGQLTELRLANFFVRLAPKAHATPRLTVRFVVSDLCRLPSDLRTWLLRV
jgi:hypothetical protein